MRKMNFLVYFERHITGPQREIFQGRGGLTFRQKHRKEGPAGKNFGIVFPRYS